MPSKTKHKNTTNKLQNKTKKTSRPSPSESATSLPEGNIRPGGNDHRWVIVNTSKGIPRWVPLESCELNGWRLLTVDYVAKNIGKPIEIYETTYRNDFWPGKKMKMSKSIFIPNGDAEINSKKLSGWLKKDKKQQKKGHVLLLGKFDMYGDIKKTEDYVDYSLILTSGYPKQVFNPKQVVINDMNTDCFIKV